MAGFVPGFPVKCNFDGLSPATIQFQPSPFLIFCCGGVVVSLSLDSGSSSNSQSQSLSLSRSELLSLSDETSSYPSLVLSCTFVKFLFGTANVSCNQPSSQLGGTKNHILSRSIHNLKIDAIYTYYTPVDRVFFQLSNGIRHGMPSTDRKLELQANDIDVSTVSQPAVYLPTRRARSLHRRLCVPKG